MLNVIPNAYILSQSYLYLRPFPLNTIINGENGMKGD